MTGSGLLAARGLGCAYRGSGAILEGVDLEFGAGELVLLAGHGASGKTSLLRCLNGLLPRSYRGATRTGDVRLDGRELAELDGAEIGVRVGTLLQDPSRQVVGVDVWREIAFGLENLGRAPATIEAAVARAAERLGIEALLPRRTAELSGGELQKVALAGVLAMEPSVLLLDEPLAALDPASARDVARLLRSLADEGRAVLVVEHRVEQLLDAGLDRALLLEGGRLVYTGGLDGFFARADPRHLHLPVDVARARWRELDATGAGGESAPAAPRARRVRSDVPAVEFDGVAFAYRERDGRRALDGASLRVERGERLALLGANGSGKSTLLRHAIGLLRADEGTVRVGGVDVAGRTTAELARDVGYVFQDPGAMLFADTVREECSFGPASAGHPPEVVRRRVDAALRRVHLEDLADAAPGALSLGQKKRVTLAAIAAGGVSVWLVDEPTAGLDPAGVEDFLDALGEAGEGGDAATVILATHDVDLALTFADRVAIVERGKVVAVGAPAELLTDPGWLERARLCTTSLVEANRGRFARGLAPLSARALAREEGA